MNTIEAATLDAAESVLEMDALSFSAFADFNQSGQYIAKLVGRAPRVTFAREFIGRKSGKRNDYTTACVDEPCLLEIVDATRKGKRRQYLIVAEGEPDCLEKLVTDESDAMAIAKRIGDGESLGDIVCVEKDENRWVYSIVPKGTKKQQAPAVDVPAAMTSDELARTLAPRSESEVLAEILRLISGLTAEAQRSVLHSATACLEPSSPELRHFVLIQDQEYPTNTPSESEWAETVMRSHGQLEAVIWRCIGPSCNAVKTEAKLFVKES